jgi:hypothetical protein
MHHPLAELADDIAVQVNQLALRYSQLEAVATQAILALGQLTDFTNREQCEKYAWIENDFENVVGHELRRR